MKRNTIPGGLLVAIEGIDGAGKTTIAAGLKAALDATGAAVVVSKEPTAGPWGMRLRESAASGRLGPVEEVKFLLRDRQQHVTEVIRPALERGEIVILDRYYPSMVAYQGALGYPVDRLLASNGFAPSPDLLLLVDVSPEMGLGRIRARGDAPNHFETHETLMRSRQIFLDLNVPNKHVIDGRKPAANVLEESLALLCVALADKVASSMGATPEALGIVMGVLPKMQAARA